MFSAVLRGFVCVLLRAFRGPSIPPRCNFGHYHVNVLLRYLTGTSYRYIYDTATSVLVFMFNFRYKTGGGHFMSEAVGCTGDRRFARYT